MPSGRAWRWSWRARLGRNGQAGLPAAVARGAQRALALVPALSLHVCFVLALVLRMAFRMTDPPSWDAVDFTLALDFYDLGRMQPHFPGYPVYIWLGRWVRLVVGEPVLALSTLSALAGAVAVYPLAALAGACGARATVAAALWAVHPLLVVLGVQPLSDGPGLLFFLAVLAVAAGGSTATPPSAGRGLLAGLLFGQLLGVRLSYWPAGVTALAWLAARRWQHGRAPEPGAAGAPAAGNPRLRGRLQAFLPALAAFAAGTVLSAGLWLLWLAGQEGLARYLTLGRAFTYGHFTQWGGTAWTPGSDAWGRLRALLGSSGAVGALGAWYPGGGPARLVASVALVGLDLLATAGWAAGRWQPDPSRQRPACGWGRCYWVAWVLPYGLWVALGQNVDHPRHLAPLVPALLLALARLAGPPGAAAPAGPARGREGAARWLLALLGLAWGATGFALAWEAGRVPPPVVRLADFLATHGDAARSAVFTWEEERVIEYRHPQWTAVRVRSPGYFRQMVAALPPGTTVYVTSPVAVSLGQLGGGQLVVRLEPLARFRGSWLLYPGYHDLVLYRYRQP